MIRASWGAGLLAVLAWSLLGTLLLGAPSPLVATAQAQATDSDPLDVAVTDLLPLNPQPGDTITISGTVSNTSSRSVTGIEVQLRVSPQALISRSEVSAVTDQTTTRRGVSIGETRTDVAAALAPAEEVPFQVTAALDDLPLAGNGVYAVLVEVLTDEVGAFATSFPLPWFPNPEILDPSGIVVLAPVRAKVDMGARNDLRSPALISQLAPGGPLANVVTGNAAAAAAGVPVSWLIDPAVAQAAGRLAQDQASFPPSITDPGAARGTAGQWLSTLADALAADGAELRVGQYAEVDAAGAVAAGQVGLLDQSLALTASADALPPADGPIALLPDDTATPDTLVAYAQRGVDLALLDSALLPTTGQPAYTPSGVDAIEFEGDRSMQAVLPDERLAAHLARPSATADDQFLLQQGLLGDAAMITLELPQAPRLAVLLEEEPGALDAAVYAQALTALAQAPYIELSGLSALLQPDVRSEPRTSRLPGDDPDRLSSEYLAPIPGLQARLDAFSRVTVDPLAFAADFRDAILRGASSHWRTDTAGGEALLASIDDDLTEEEQKVTTVSTGTVTFSGNSGTLPLTISNELDQAVEVGVVLQSDPAVRLAFTPPGLVFVDAGKRVSIEIAVEVFGSGPLPVSVILTDREGRPFITTGDLVIQSSATSMVAALVAIIGAVAFVAMVLWRFRRKGGPPDE